MNKHEHFKMYQDYENKARYLREEMKQIQKQLEQIENEADYHFNKWYQKATFKE